MLKIKWLSDLIWLTFFLSIFYMLWMGSYALFTPDEGRYSEIAREMIATKDYITPRLNGVVFLDKPILYYWLQASAIHLFGLKEWALRFWPVCLGIFGALYTYVAGYLLFNRRVGILSALILATSPLYFGGAHYANLDLEVAVLISASLFSFIIAMKVKTLQVQTPFLLIAYFFAGLAALTKGLIGLAFPMMIIGLWIFLLNRWVILKKMRIVTGLLLFFVITLPWYIAVQKANPEFFQFFFLKQQVARFLTTEHFNNRTPIWFYLPIVIAGLFPWCIFLIPALASHVKNCWENRQKYATELFLLIWLVFIFIFFSIPKSKTIGYILPTMPALALLLGSFLSQFWEKNRSFLLNISVIFYLIVCAAILGACCFVAFFKPTYAHLSWYLGFIAMTFSFSAISIIQFRKNLFPTTFYILFITACTFLLIVIAGCNEINQKTIKPLATQIKSHLKPTDEIVAYYKYSQDLPLYLERRITIVADWTSPTIPFNDNWIRELWYGMPFQNTKEWLINENTFWQRWNSSKHLFVFTDKSYLRDLEKKSIRPIYKIGQFNNEILVSNQLDLAKDPVLS